MKRVGSENSAGAEGGKNRGKALRGLRDFAISDGGRTGAARDEEAGPDRTGRGRGSKAGRDYPLQRPPWR